MEKKREVQGSSIPWMYVSLVLLAALAIVVGLYLFQPSRGQSEVKTPEACGREIVSYINDYIVTTTEKASFVSVERTNGLYRIQTSYQGQRIPVYATEDCVLLFLSQPVNVTESVETPTPTRTPTPTPTMEKREKPVVELYVMAFCPYGVQAENAMQPVAALLKGSIDLKIRYIASSTNETVEGVRSLHGTNEAKEDLRQLCIQKLYPERFWDYLMQVNSECYPLYRNDTALEGCWKKAAQTAGIDIQGVEACAYGRDGIGLLKEDEALVSQHGVTGSPTLLINGVRYSGARSPEAFKQAICNAFIAPPAACTTNLSASQTAAQGQC